MSYSCCKNCNAQSECPETCEVNVLEEEIKQLKLKLLYAISCAEYTECESYDCVNCKQ